MLVGKKTQRTENGEEQTEKRTFFSVFSGRSGSLPRAPRVVNSGFRFAENLIVWHITVLIYQPSETRA
jgi:hypothetical protein